MVKHQSVSRTAITRTRVLARRKTVDTPMSSDGSEVGDLGGDDPNDLVEDCFDVATHGGGSLESVPGFGIDRAMTEGFGPESEEVTEELANLTASCLMEFEEPESVCGRDDRRRISPASAIPWWMICQLFIQRHDGRTSRCTGWFIGPRTVMTAGHCVYSQSAGGWARSITVVPGMDDSSRPFGTQVGTTFRSVSGWIQNRDVGYDYGAIILSNGDLGRRVGWFGFAALSDDSLRNLPVNNSGYPADKPTGTQWSNAGRITRVTARRLYYMLDTAGGQSGSPTWRSRRAVRHAIGVHAYGGCPNKSTRITRTVDDNMMRWKNVT